MHKFLFYFKEGLNWQKGIKHGTFLKLKPLFFNEKWAKLLCKKLGTRLNLKNVHKLAKLRSVYAKNTLIFLLKV